MIILVQLILLIFMSFSAFYVILGTAIAITSGNILVRGRTLKWVYLGLCLGVIQVLKYVIKMEILPLKFLKYPFVTPLFFQNMCVVHCKL